jgi:anti-anti-sigma factor
VTDGHSTTIEYHDSVGVVRVAGEVEITQANALRERLLSAIRNRDVGLVVDLSQASYIDSVGVSLLFELADRLSGRQLRFAVVVPEEGLVDRVLTIVNLSSVAEVHRDVGGALAAIHGRD